MKNILDDDTRNEIIDRILALRNDAKPKWGSMTLYQMLKHCTLWEEMVQGKIELKNPEVFPGISVLEDALSNPMPKLGNSSPELIVHEKNGDVELQKKVWIKVLKDYDNYKDTFFLHPFFGEMTREQIGTFAYKHSDHHLRQFSG